MLDLRIELHSNTNSEDDEILMELKNSITKLENSEKSLASRIDQKNIG